MRRYINIHTHHFTGRHIELQAQGIHPWEAEKVDVSLLNIADYANIKAIGEIGLDYAHALNHASQEMLFTKQLEIAENLHLPVILHCVKAFEPTMNLLLKYSLKAVIFHGFIGSKQQASEALKRGYYLSFGHRTAHSPKSIEALRCTPLSQLFIETDEAEVSIEDMYASIASLRCVSLDELCHEVENNYKRIFGDNE